MNKRTIGVHLLLYSGAILLIGSLTFYKMGLPFILVTFVLLANAVLVIKGRYFYSIIVIPALALTLMASIPTIIAYFGGSLVTDATFITIADSIIGGSLFNSAELALVGSTFITLLCLMYITGFIIVRAGNTRKNLLMIKNIRLNYTAIVIAIAILFVPIYDVVVRGHSSIGLFELGVILIVALLVLFPSAKKR